MSIKLQQRPCEYPNRLQCKYQTLIITVKTESLCSIMNMKISVVKLESPGLWDVNISDHQPALIYGGLYIKENTGSSVLPFQSSLWEV